MSNNARRRELAAATLAILTERFPQALAMQESRRRPLKIGIDRDFAVAASDISRRSIRDALRLYVDCASYRNALVQAADRIDIAGVAAGVVTAQEAAKAIDDPQRRRTAQAAASIAPTAPPPAAMPAPLASARPKLSLAALREAAQRRKTERGPAD